MPRFRGQRIRDKNSISIISAKRPPSPKPIPSPVPIPAPAPPPVQRVPKLKYDETFMLDAVRCWLISGKPAHVAAADLGNKAERRCHWNSQLASMSRKANCYDDAAMESFWATLKLDLVYRMRFLTHADAHQQIFDSIARFYIIRCLHIALGYLSPAQFEQQS